MALRFSRFGIAFIRVVKARKLIYRHYNFAPQKTFFLSFLGVTLGKKSTEKLESPKMTEFNALLKTADQFFEENKFQETVDFLKTIDDQSNPEVLWRLGRAIFKLSGTESSSAKKAELIRESFKLLSTSLEKDDNNFAIHKWYAILLDANSNLGGIKERVQQLENVQKHMKRAIDLNPNDPTSHYILGEFEYGLADLPWVQRKIVSTIFASPPQGDFERALDNFLKAESLEANFYSMNLLMIGKCYYQLKNTECAKEYLTKASNIVVLNEDDRKCKEEAEKLLKKIK